MIGRIMLPSPKDAYVLNPGNLHDKREFTDMFKDLERGDYPGEITRILIIERQECQSERRRCDSGSRGWSDVL